MAFSVRQRSSDRLPETIAANWAASGYTTHGRTSVSASSGVLPSFDFQSFMATASAGFTTIGPSPHELSSLTISYALPRGPSCVSNRSSSSSRRSACACSASFRACARVSRASSSCFRFASSTVPPSDTRQLVRVERLAVLHDAFAPQLELGEELVRSLLGGRGFADDAAHAGRHDDREGAREERLAHGQVHRELGAPIRADERRLRGQV